MTYWIKVRAVPGKGVYVQCPCCYEEFLVSNEKIDAGFKEIICENCGLKLPKLE